MMKRVSPDVVVISQGNIEVSWLGLVAAKRAGLRTISYIPMAQTLGSGSGFISRCRAILDRGFYRLPNKFITISESAKRALWERGAKAEIDVVPNGIEFRHSAADRAMVRHSYGFSENDYVTAVIGRIAFQQKAQDFLVQALARYRDQLRDFHFCVIGEGPDEEKLRNMIQEMKVGDSVSIFPWHSDISSFFYSAIDLLLIPSHFEGVPLVMLEAMWHGVPIVASDVDGMAEMLPGEWLFRRGDAESLVNTLLNVQRVDSSEFISAHKRRVVEEFNVSKFQKRFCTAVLAGVAETAGPASETTSHEKVPPSCASELI
jgi:glycosyltransferase involved in cell wall biosynthesis